MLPEPVYSVDPATIDVSTAASCDITQPDYCLFPFPNDFFTTEDVSANTGRRVSFDAAVMPLNLDADPFDVTEHNRNDGFSPGPLILAQIPGVSLSETGAAPLTDIGLSLATDAPIQVLNATTGEPQLIWTELDSYAPPESGLLMIRVAKNLTPGERYIVVLRNLRDADGATMEPSDAFKVFQEQIPSDIEAFESRREHMESLFSALSGFGIERESLFLTWDFTVASSDNITGRAVHMRDTALANLAGAAPSVVITEVIELAPTDPGGADLARTVRGTVEVSNFLSSASGDPGSVLNYDSLAPDALPVQLNGNATVAVPFVCAIPPAAFADAADFSTDTRAVIAGHGLFGDRDSVLGLAALANDQNLIYCGMDWWGMSNQDLGVTFGVLSNISLFPTLVDRLQQAFVNKILLSEALVKSDGFASEPAFQHPNGTPLFKAGEVHYDGLSQGGILGGALTALNPHFERSVLMVPGLRFSLLMRRSNAWAGFSIGFDPAYPEPVDKAMGLALLQMLWDRGENNGYSGHITRNPLPGSSASRVLVQAAVGDATVTETAAEVLARSLQLHRHVPTVVAGRHIAVEPYVGIDSIDAYPFAGSALIIFDSGPFPIAGHDGTQLQPVANTPQSEGYNTHGMPFSQEPAWQQKGHFWRTGEVLNVCGASACFGDGYDGTPGEYVAP
ncbi:hypothetical protein EYC98_12350 [Halieaceae bacterium IMCC14734]|uniref:Bacterial virulence factor lipase N-terminal domain-containing protein n=1 Tax=Candidatus Litorirhabdus singularis TaxID=2518993 RepID=A0ABT3THA4_9GAMM|nr:hypothetical protein [Candidatus Litorirhabdus singularis]MCX2981654.1 hypothetical protein [Candidatus Litorirhabdus singularis]